MQACNLNSLCINKVSLYINIFDIYEKHTTKNNINKIFPFDFTLITFQRFSDALC